MLNELKEWLANRLGRSEEAALQSHLLTSFAQRMEQHYVAETFAEAGIQDVAEEIVRQDMEEPAKILVLGSGGLFPRPVIDYAVGFAKRTGYEVVALSCVPVGHEPANGAENLARRAAEEGIACHQVTKYGTSDHCIREVHDEMRRVEFVVTEPEAGVEWGTEPVIPVFCLSK